MSDYRESLQRKAGEMYSTSSADDSRGAAFVNPSNGHREEVGEQAWLWAFLAGPFYLAARGLWGHAAIYVLVLMFSVLVAGPLTILLAPALWVGYAAAVKGLVRGRYQRMGWLDAVDWDNKQRAEPARLAEALTPLQTAPPVSMSSVADELGKLAQLRTAGVLTEEEFASQKAKLLG